MAPRTSWKGFLRLSLVSVPVKAFTANATGAAIRLNQLHEECNSRVKYQKACPIHGTLANDEIVKGYEYAKDQYVVIDPDEISKLRTESDKTITMDGFIPADSIDPVYFSGRTYYLAPDGIAGLKPYHLLLQSMEERGIHAIAKIVLSGREQLVLVRPHEGVLALTMVSYANTVKAVDTFKDEVGEATFSKEEMKLTATLIDASMVENFDLSAYEDDYITKMNELIQKKVDGEEIVTATPQEEPQILNLMEALKASVADAQQQAKPAKKKMAKNTSGKASKKSAAAKRRSG